MNVMVNEQQRIYRARDAARLGCRRAADEAGAPWDAVMWIEQACDLRSLVLQLSPQPAAWSVDRLRGEAAVIRERAARLRAAGPHGERLLSIMLGIIRESAKV